MQEQNHFKITKKEIKCNYLKYLKAISNRRPVYRQPVYKQLIPNFGSMGYFISNLFIIVILIVLINFFYNLKMRKWKYITLIIFSLVALLLSKILDLSYDVFLEIDRKKIREKLSKTDENTDNLLWIKKEAEIYVKLLKLSYESPILTSFITASLGFIIGKISDLKLGNMEAFISLIIIGVSVIFFSFYALEVIKGLKRYKLHLYQILIFELERFINK